MRLILLLAAFLFIGCEKQQDCFTCTQVWSGYYNGSKTWIVCDVLEAAELNGKKESKITTLGGGAISRTTYITKCK
jgi:hypothetical protein